MCFSNLLFLFLFVFYSKYIRICVSVRFDSTFLVFIQYRLCYESQKTEFMLCFHGVKKFHFGISSAQCLCKCFYFPLFYLKKQLFSLIKWCASWLWFLLIVVSVKNRCGSAVCMGAKDTLIVATSKKEKKDSKNCLFLM